ncbi:MAG: glutathione S-transferase family protein [Polyangiales bacterium]
MTTLTLLELEQLTLPAHESWSPFCLKANRALRASGLSYTRRTGSRPDAWRKYNATGQVPVLLVDERPVRDSTAILREIEKLSGRSLSGNSPAERAESWLYEELADTSINGFLVAARWADERNWPRTRDAYFHSMPALIKAIIPGRLRAGVLANLVARDVWRAGPDACWSHFQHILDRLDERAPAKGFWIGEQLSAADLALFGQLHSMRTELTPWQHQRVDERPRLSAWLDRVHLATWNPANARVPSSTPEEPCAAQTDSFASSNSSAAQSATR